MVEQKKAVSGIARRIPKPPARACRISTTIISMLNKPVSELVYTLKTRTTDNELPTYARISVYAVAPKMSRPMVKPERNNASNV
jgi:hypothetical protein